MCFSYFLIFLLCYLICNQDWRHACQSDGLPAAASNSTSAPSSSSSTEVAQADVRSAENVPYADEKRIVWVKLLGRSEPTRLGRIAEWKLDTPSHSVSCACSLHSKCSVAVKVSRLPYNSTSLVAQWLHAGIHISRNTDGAAKQHTDLFKCYVPLNS